MVNQTKAILKNSKNLLTTDMYYKAIEGSDSGLWVCDVKNDICYLSNRYYQMLGYGPGEFEGTMSNLFALLHPDDVKKSSEVLAPVFNGTIDSYRNEVRLRSKSGQYIPILTQGRVERDEENKVTRLIGWNIDISLLKEAQRKLDEERALNLANTRLAQLGLFSGGVAHEINNPLTVIQVRTEMLIRSLREGKILNQDSLIENLTTVQNASRKIADIIEGLRTLADGGNDDTRSMVSLKQAVEEVTGLFRQELDKKGIALHVAAPSEGFTVMANFALLCQVLLNLIQNSADALEDELNKNIWVTITSLSDAARIDVEDDGPGVKEEDIEKIMLPFFTTKPPGKGTGLGLSISKSIIESFSGTLTYKPADGRTRFSITLPKIVHMPKTQL